jgi:hypothetical protein
MVPSLAAAFESGQMPSGFTSDLPLLHHDGHDVWVRTEVTRGARGGSNARTARSPTVRSAC